ncbi:MAG: hypothetical protein HKM06_07295 [Spirochaetales bacterium]|nr:hypothetical protein [Spirochaetales bacterium]
MDTVRCPNCQKNVVPKLTWYRPSPEILRKTATQHICPFCGVVMYETGGGGNLLAKILGVLVVLGLSEVLFTSVGKFLSSSHLTAIFTALIFYVVPFAVVVLFLTLPASPGAKLIKKFAAHVRQKRADYLATHPGKRLYFRVAKDLHTGQFFLESSVNRFTWRTIPQTNKRFYIPWNLEGSVKTFPDQESAVEFIENYLKDYQSLLHDWELRHRKAKAVRGKKIY